MTAHAQPVHGHQWHLADGTGLHAPVGELVAEEGTGRLCCHLCGNWYTSLGAHVRAHGHTADSYREELGLPRSAPLTRQRLSAAISARQKKAYQDDENFRERFAEGQRDARAGALTRRAVEAKKQNPLSSGARARQARALDAGRATTARHRQARLDRLIRDTGSNDLAAFLRERYQEGSSLAQLASETGLGRSRLHDEMLSARIELRSPGHNTSAGRRSRALAADDAAARRVGTDNLRQWLRDRREEGWTLTALGVAVGHSNHWVKWRLEDGD